MAKPTVSIHFKLAGFVDRKMITAEFDLDVPEGSSIKDLFGLVDKSKKTPPKVMKKIMKSIRPPTIMVNGGALDLPEELTRRLAAGDEVAVMTPIAGG